MSRLGRTAAFVAADPACTVCDGAGVSRVRGNTCNCVYRRVFRDCLEQWQEVGERPPWLGDDGAIGFGFPGCEFRADFEATARRVLDDAHLRVFRMYWLEGTEWTACTAALDIDRGNFFHAAYRIAKTVGRELLRQGLWPVANYFRPVLARVA